MQITATHTCMATEINPCCGFHIRIESSGALPVDSRSDYLPVIFPLLALICRKMGLKTRIMTRLCGFLVSEMAPICSRSRQPSLQKHELPNTRMLESDWYAPSCLSAFDPTMAFESIRYALYSCPDDIRRSITSPLQYHVLGP